MNAIKIKRAIEDLESYAQNSWGELSESFELAIKALKKLLNDDWISVNDRLPECYDVDFLVTTESGDIVASKFYGYGEECQGFKEYPEGVWEIDAYEETVIAWQPLPKKYKER